MNWSKDCFAFRNGKTDHWIALTYQFLYDDNHVYTVQNWPLAYYILCLQEGMAHPESMQVHYPPVIAHLPTLYSKHGKSDYLIDPTLPQMLDMDDKQLKKLHTLSVTRKDVGKIVFLDAVDVTAIDIFQIVTIERLKASVIPPACLNVKIGEKLNYCDLDRLPDRILKITDPDPEPRSV